MSATIGTLLLAAFAAVAWSAASARSAEAVAVATASWRRVTLWGLVTLFVPAIGYSLTRMPYPTGGQPPAAVVVEATGHQWSWELTPSTVPAGQLVEIRVTGADVNHGLGLYDANGRLVTQTQGMPGFTNVIRHTFTAPGTYRILCLEYCGLGHHTMASQLVVTTAR
ncbi:MAG TPA: hypothetical protein VKA84_25675 [Gemmatimonadaceae bacterium]|nr:hypothetical protein [Gemmatimonadaceae bacterium]